MALNEFYKQVIENMGLYVSEDGFIYSSGNKDKVLITNDGKPMVLPMKEHINSVFDKDEDGNIVVTKTLFNPIDEDVVKGDSPSLKKLKIFAERRFSHIFNITGLLLLSLAANKDLQKKTGLEINKFLSSITQAQSQGIKNLVDDKSIDNWNKIYENTLKKPNGLFTIFLKKKGKYQGETYNRLAVLGSDTYDELIKAEKDDEVTGVKLRNKDIVIFKLIYNYIIEDFEEEGTMSVGSNDNESPAFISLMSLYLKLITRTNRLLKYLKDINQELFDSAFIPSLISTEKLFTLKEFSNELITIPNETDLNRSTITLSKIDDIPSSILNTTTVDTRAQQSVQQPVNNLNQQPYPKEPVRLNQPAMDDDPMRRALGSNFNIIQQPPHNGYMGLNSMGYQQQMFAPQPQFVGLNNNGIGYPQGQVINSPGSYYQQPGVYPNYR